MASKSLLRSYSSTLYRKNGTWSDPIRFQRSIYTHQRIKSDKASIVTSQLSSKNVQARLTTYRTCSFSTTSSRYAIAESKTSKKTNLSTLRNISFWGHIDAGKTTLTEKVLYLANALLPPPSSTQTSQQLQHKSSRMLPGDVDSGSTVTDFLEAERQRGITIQSAAVGPFTWKTTKKEDQANITLVDTPGHIDFTIEVERSLRVCDGCVILIDGVEGVESQTEGVWKIAKRYNVRSHVAFVNKMDRLGASLIKSIQSIIQRGIHSKPVLLQLPVYSQQSTSSLDQESLLGLIDLTSVNPMMVNFFGGKAGEEIESMSIEEAIKQKKINESVAQEAYKARSTIIENLANVDEELLEQTLKAMENDQVGDDYTILIDQNSLKQSIRRLVVSGEILPVLCGSAAKGVGVQPVLDAIVDYLPSPDQAGDFDAATERNLQSGCVWGKIRGGTEGDSNAAETKKKKGHQLIVQKPTDSNQTNVSVSVQDQALSLLAFKVVWDKRKGPMTFVRLYSGSLSRSTTLLNTTTGTRERLSKILFVYADRHIETESLEAGQIGVLLGLKDTRTGDTLVDVRPTTGKQQTSKKDQIESWSKFASSLRLRQVNVPPPVFSMSIEPLSKSDEGPLREALDMLIRTDPSLHLDQGTSSSSTGGLGSIAASTGGQMVLSGMGELHLEIARDRLTEEFGARAHLGDVRVSYRETLASESEEKDKFQEHLFDRDILGQKLKASFEMSIRSLLPEEEGDVRYGGNEVIVEDIVQDEEYKDDATAKQSQQHRTAPLSTSNETFDNEAIRRTVQAGLNAALSRGPLSGNPVTGLHIHVRNVCSFGPAMSPAKAFSLLATQALRESLKSKGVILMEPFMDVRIQCDEDSLGKVVGNLTSEQNGTVEQVDHAIQGGSKEISFGDASVYLPPPDIIKDGPSSSTSSSSFETSATMANDGKCTINAIVPLVRLVRYSSTLRALTKGKATYEMAFKGFQTVSPDRQREILIELGRL